MGCCSSASSGQEPGRKAAPPPADVLAKKLATAKATRVLALRECGLKQLPNGAVGPEFAQLRTADLAGNSLKELPSAIGTWTGLHNLLCGGNQLTDLPSAVGQLAQLQKLVLSGNRLRTLPVELAKLGKLKTLMLDGNCLAEGMATKQFNSDVFSGEISASLEELDLSGNALEELPQSVASFRSLKRLICHDNRLKAFPSDLSRVSSLQYVDASNNRLTFLPETLFVDLTQLSEMWLKGNPMERLHLQKSEGFEGFMERRRQRLDAKIDANVVGRVNLAVCGLE